MAKDSNKKSRLYALKPIVERWPAIKKPKGHVHFRKKLLWTATCLIIYFVLTQVLLYGVAPEQLDIFAGYRAIIAGASGSVVHLGIGPIVTASIILQLFVGANIINLDLQDPKDKSLFQGVQKILVMIMILVEAIPQVFGYLSPSASLEASLGGPAASAVIVAQLFMGGFLIFWMDETISKWGIGSGVSLFIAAGVSEAIITGTFNWLPQDTAAALSVNNPPAGVLPKTAYLASEMSLGDLIGGGFETIFISPPNPVIAFLATAVIFFFVVYAQSSRVELPLTHARVRGARGRYPLKLVYTSVLPVILISALMANINMFALLLYTKLQNFPLLGGQWWLGKYLAGSTEPVAGAAWYLNSPRGLHTWLFPMIDQKYSQALAGHEPWQMILRIVIYGAIFIVGTIFFGKFWVETTNMGPEAVASQIEDSGMQIPGFRRDPRILKKVLKRYIPALTVLSSIIVASLALFANLIGTVGNTSGTGVLLAVGIVIQLYEQIAREQAMEMHPVLRKFLGVE